ncbi:MAG TPA: PTS sugar transporter subunit IIA [Longimicrobiales bacterium]
MPEVLTTKQLARYLQISERSVYRLLERGQIPAVKIGGQWRFRKSVVDEWLDLQFGSIEPTDIEPEQPEGERAPGGPVIADLLSPENIVLDLPARVRAGVLDALVDRIVLPEPVDRNLLLARLLEREALCSTAIADGIAIPHTPRTRARLLQQHDLVAIGRTLEPVDFGALDGKPTSVFILVLARDQRTHLTLLAKLMRLAREPAVRDALLSGTAEEILAAIREGEEALFGGVAAR